VAITITSRSPDGTITETPYPGDASPEVPVANGAEPDAPGATTPPPAGETPPSDSPPEPPAPASGEGAGDADEPDSPDDAPVSAGYINRRISRLTARHRGAERALEAERATNQQTVAELRAQMQLMTQLLQGGAPPLPDAPTGPPQAEQFQSHDDYVRATARYEAQQIAQQQHQQTTQQQQMQEMQRTVLEREAAFKAQHADYDDVLRAGLVGKVSPPLQQALLLHPDGPALAYQLATQPAVVARLNQLPPPLMLMELGRLAPGSPQANGATTDRDTGTRGHGDAGTGTPSLAASPRPSVPASPLPPPLAPLTGRGAAPPESPAEWSQAEFRKKWDSGWRPSPRDLGR
jgi:hypothetical protein